MGTDPYAKHMQAAIDAANAARNVLMARFDNDPRTLDSWEKSPGALVTEADIESDNAIAAALDASGCGGVILSEESNVDLGASGTSGGPQVEWLIDPLCGTVPFSTGINHWGINIAMRADGELVLSALAVPTSDTLITASKHDGVRLNGEHLRANPSTRELGEVAVGLEIDGQDQWRELLGTGGLDWVTRAGQINGFSSAAYPLMLICTGRLSAVVFYRIEPMHVAAGALAAEMLGARATDINGQPIDWSSDEELPVFIVGWHQALEQLLDALGE